ncbi:MAG: phenylacetic acid degradation operon negative regulatory protein [Candidatus Berkelbacteria bacterium Athens1014_28]|uniref:Phenylacetic acid degradation operon negative regulatory protein n=1 Tax=Candidatus Berkelbacteria bacterium Athens1014_28 TaxID=2017145 RepID=A0A554LNE4_9BACT|nr:MAG: phenylacetic acid degradation operon negative regulatory protein [Candidatus Berkelbacteria bacterium Athens1014_28]
MKKQHKELLKISAKELLLSLFDLSVPFFQASSIYRKNANDYINERRLERSEFWDRVKYLRRMGYIQTFVDKNQKYLELTKKGKLRGELFKKEIKEIRHPIKWDGKFRLVIFDVPEKHKTERDLLRSKLKQLNFIQIQKSVYAHPFECTEAIGALTYNYNLSDYVSIFIADAILGEENIIDHFLDRKILSKKDLRALVNKN